ncbi:hypothetical protein D3C72_193680 [compost metagenome]
MFERSSYPLTGRWARHLLRLANTSKIPVDASLREVAKQRSYDVAMVPAHLKFSRKEYDAIQYLLDWNCRAVLLDHKGISYSRHISLFAAQTIGAKSIAVFCRGSRQVAEWVELIKLMAPGEPIFTKVNKDPRGNITPHSEETAGRKWVIGEFREFQDVSMVSDHKIDHMIVEKDEKELPYDSIDSLSGLCLEIQRTTFIVQSSDFWVDQSDYKSQSSIGTLSVILSEYLRTNKHMARVPTLFGTSQNVAMYFRKRGRRYNLVSLFEASGACFDLVVEPTSIHFRNNFSNTMLVNEGANSNRRNDSIKRYETVEAQVTGQAGQTTSEIIDLALSGDAVAVSRLELLKTGDWAKLKANMFYNNLRVMSNSEDKVIIVAKHPGLRKFLSFSTSIIDVTPGFPDTNQKLSNYVYPAKSCQSFDDLPFGFKNRISNTIMVNDLADVDIRALEVTEQVIFAEFGYDTQLVSDYIELSKAFGFKITFGTMRGTFEEELAEKLLESFY